MQWWDSHDPDILHGAAFEHPTEMGLALETACRNVNEVVDNLQLPASNKPAIDIRRVGNFRRAARSRERDTKAFRVARFRRVHRPASCWRYFLGLALTFSAQSSQQTRTLTFLILTVF